MSETNSILPVIFYVFSLGAVTRVFFSFEIFIRCLFRVNDGVTRRAFFCVFVGLVKAAFRYGDVRALVIPRLTRNEKKEAISESSMKRKDFVCIS